MVIINVPIQTYISYEISNAEKSLISKCYSGKEALKNMAIGFMRMQYGLSFKDGKDLCDKVAKDFPYYNIVPD